MAIKETVQYGGSADVTITAEEVADLLSIESPKRQCERRESTAALLQEFRSLEQEFHELQESQKRVLARLKEIIDTITSSAE